MMLQFILIAVGVGAGLCLLYNAYGLFESPYAYEDNKRSGDHEMKYREREDECTICLERMEPNTYITLNPCKHTFHKRCIGAYMHRHVEVTCPNCRQSFS